MSYVDGFILAVPTANKERFLEGAREFDQMFIDNGALRVVECWGDDVPHGKRNDLFTAVLAIDTETVVFSWVEWPDKATRDTGMAKMQQVIRTEERFDQTANPPPFDGMRMIFGGFVPILTLENER